MSIDTAAIDPELLADAEAVLTAITSGKKPDSELVQRIQARSEQIRERVFREHGFVDIAVPAVRELRDA
ncbi:MAG: hypothetical protein B7Z73_13125 [Planctomycetia bacterium 21-64-5]|nr:MAG: hypothetical protein B7Z73_13125 [Planctomycetia bacterium 21-64-5]HQU45592.1 hypothetical protein [Pirellulales bacterium]